MKKALFVLLTLSQTACVSALIPHDPQPINTYAPARMVEEHRQKHAAQWAEWDKTYVTDDTKLIEIYDKNGNLVLVGQAK